MITERPDSWSLAGDIAGQIICRETSKYEPARRVWNAMIDKRPLGIVRCAGADDVVAAIAYLCAVVTLDGPRVGAAASRFTTIEMLAESSQTKYAKGPRKVTYPSAV